MVASGADALMTTVKTCMREPLVTIETSETIVEAVRLMKEQGTRYLAVTEKWSNCRRGVGLRCHSVLLWRRVIVNEDKGHQKTVKLFSGGCAPAGQLQ